MSFEFGNQLFRGLNNAINNGHAIRAEFLRQWHSPRAMHIDFEKAGINPLELSVTLNDCDVQYAYADHGHVVFLTEYHNQTSMEKDRELIDAAASLNCVISNGLKVAITMDEPTGAVFLAALKRARR